MIAAGRPATVPSMPPPLFLTGCGQVMPRLARCSIRPKKNGRSRAATRFFIEREDEIALAGMDQEIRVLDPLRDALVGQKLADIVAGQKGPKILRRNVGIDGHQMLRPKAKP